MSAESSLRDEEEFSLASTSPIGSLGDLTRALKGATATPRFFRSVSQWTAAFWRWAVAAVAAQHITMPQVIAHQDVVLQICEQERLRSRPPYAGFLYDEMARKQWARRTEKKDPSFNLDAETQKLDKDLRELVTQRLGAVMRITEVEGSVPSSAGSTIDERLSQQLAAAEAAQKKAAAVTKSLTAAQRNIIDKAVVASSADGAPKIAAPEEEKQMTGKQLKAHKWFLKQKERGQQQQIKKKHF